MHPLRHPLGLLVALAAACNQPGGTTTSTESGATETGGATADGTTSTTTGATSTTDAPTSGDSGTGSTSASTSASASTTDVSATGTASSGEATTDAPGTASSSSGGGDPPPLTEYCDCMVVECHDQYHAKFGEEHRVAEMLCLEYAASIPSVGAPAMSGNSIECYTWACAQGDCEAALGGGACQ